MWVMTISQPHRLPFLLGAFVYTIYVLFPAKDDNAAKRFVAQACVVIFGAYLFSAIFVGDRARLAPGIGPVEVLPMAVALGVILAGILLPRLYNLITLAIESCFTQHFSWLSHSQHQRPIHT